MCDTVKMKSKQRIIHITGYSGSGKTTIGKKLKTNDRYDVYDTDEISEQAHKELFRKFPKLFQLNEEKYWQKYHLMIKAFIKHVLKTDNDVVIVGFAIDVNKLIGNKIEGYILDVDKKLLYRRRALRDFEFLCKHQAKIERIIKKEPVELIEQKLWMEGVHQSFPPPPFRHAFANFETVLNEQIKKHGYVSITPQNLLKKLL